MESKPENEDVSQADCVHKAETFKCDWDGSVNHQPEALQSSGEGSTGYKSEASLDKLEVEIWELEGEELLQSLGQHITKEQELLTTPTPFERLQNIPASVWTKVEKNQHLGYNGLSKQTRQWQEQRHMKRMSQMLCCTKGEPMKLLLNKLGTKAHIKLVNLLG
ncbi:hypothetical protein V8B97DRAFT_1919024 [Scleroderma yunnanense]